MHRSNIISPPLLHTARYFNIKKQASHAYAVDEGGILGYYP